MPFTAFNKVKLAEKFPIVIGRQSDGKARMTIAQNGQCTFNVAATELLNGCSVIQPAWDLEKRRLMLTGFESAPKGKEASCWDIGRGKEHKAKTASIKSPVMILKEIGYDYHSADLQTYVAVDTKPEKHMLIFEMPSETPKPKPKSERKAKAAKNGAGAKVEAKAEGKAEAKVEDEDVVEVDVD